MGFQEEELLPEVYGVGITRVDNGSAEMREFKLSFFFFGPRPQHMEVPRLGAESELQLLAYTIATAMRDPSCICDLRHSSQKRQILNPLSKLRHGICILMDPSQMCFC